MRKGRELKTNSEDLKTLRRPSSVLSRGRQIHQALTYYEQLLNFFSAIRLLFIVRRCKQFTVPCYSLSAGSYYCISTVDLIISFTLYPAHRMGKGNLVLRHSVPHFLSNSGGHSTPQRRN